MKIVAQYRFNHWLVWVDGDTSITYDSFKIGKEWTLYKIGGSDPGYIGSFEDLEESIEFSRKGLVGI